MTSTIDAALAQKINDELAEADRQIVARRGDMTFTRGDLRAAFERVAPLNNWKTEIDTRVEITNDRDLAALREAVIFFTGSVPTLTRIGAGRHPWYAVKAAGYYRTIGA